MSCIIHPLGSQSYYSNLVCKNSSEVSPAWLRYELPKLGIAGSNPALRTISVLKFRKLSTKFVFARKFVYKQQIFVYIRSYICLHGISTAIPSLGSSYLNQAGPSPPIQDPPCDNANKELGT
jgi:hypothetical protein